MLPFPDSPGQEQIFLSGESDAWFDRNKESLLQPVDSDHCIIRALQHINISPRTTFIDLGGGSGKVSAAIALQNDQYKCTVLELSEKAIAAGRTTFPNLTFHKGSLCSKSDIPNKTYDVVIISGVLCCLDRLFLSQAVANADFLLKSGGYLLLSDFYSPFARANRYTYHNEVRMYKQDYSMIFKALGTYHLLHQETEDISNSLSRNDSSAPYDASWTTSVLYKDPVNLYYNE